MKYFYNDDYADERGMVFPLNYFQEILETENVESIELLEMERDYGGQMFCFAGECFVKKGGCNHQCKNYNPCNGKNGRCRYLENGFVETGRIFLLKKNILLRVGNPVRAGDKGGKDEKS